MKTLSFVPLALAAVLVVHDCVRAQDSTGVNLDELLSEALKNNPQIHAAREQTAASQAKIGQATSLDPPQIAVEFYQVPVGSFPNPFRNNMETDYSIQQMIPFPGKLSAMGRAAENGAEMAGQSEKAVERKIVRDLKNAYYELYLVGQKIRFNGENQDLMRRFVDIARSQYEVGMGKQEDVLRAQTELSTLANDGLNLHKERTAIVSMIDVLVNRPVTSPLGDVPDIEQSVPEWTFTQLSPIAIESRPEVKEMAYSVEMAKADLTASRREYLPDFMVRTMYKNMADTPNDYWSLMVGVTVPLWPWSSGKATSKVEENEVGVRKAEADYESMKNMTLFDVQDALVKVQTARSQVRLYRSTIIPQAEQTLQSTIASYQTGKTEFLMLIDAYRMLLMTKIDHAMAVMNLMASEARLEQAVGLDAALISEKLR